MNKDKGYIFNIQKFCLHDGAGIRTVVFFNGCNLRCKWCANPESTLPVSDIRSEAKENTVEEALKEILTDKPFYDKSGGGVTLSGGEVFMQKDFASALIRACHEKGVHVAVETAGCIDESTFFNLVKEVDFVFIDCKHYDDGMHVFGTGASNKKIISNIASLVKLKKPYCVRIPIIPDFNDREEDASAFSELFKSLGIKEVQLLPFHQMAEKKYEEKNLDYPYRGIRQKKKEDLEKYAEILESNGIRVQIGG